MPIDPAAYARVFESHHEGAQVLEDLIRRFGGALFVKGGDWLIWSPAALALLWLLSGYRTVIANVRAALGL